MQSSEFVCEKPPEGKKLSAPEKGKLNRRNYLAYVQHLRDSGRRFPVNQFGDVNLSVISELCGFERQVFSNNKSLATQLEKDVGEIGTELVEGKDVESRADNDLKTLRKQLNNARRDLALSEGKIDALQRQIVDLKAELKRSQAQNQEADESLDLMITTGRRWCL